MSIGTLRRYHAVTEPQTAFKELEEKGISTVISTVVEKDPDVVAPVLKPSKKTKE